MKSVYKTTAVLALAAAMATAPFIANAQLLGGGVSGNLGGQVSVNGATNTVDSLRQQTGAATSSLGSDVGTVQQQTGDVVTEAKGAARVDGAAKTTVDPDGQVSADGNLGVAADTGAVTGAAKSGVHSVKKDARTVTSQARHTATGAVDTATAAQISADTQAKADASASVDKK